MLLPSLLKSGDQVYQKVIKQLYQKMLLLNLLITEKTAFYLYLQGETDQVDGKQEKALDIQSGL